MKTVVWIVILFAAAVGLALASGIYTGDVFIVLGQTMLRINLHAFVLGSLIAVVVWYFLFKFIIGVFNIPEKMQRFSLARKGRKAALYLNKAGLAYFEGRFEKAELEASRVLGNKEAGDNRTLALMLPPGRWEIPNCATGTLQKLQSCLKNSSFHATSCWLNRH